MTTLTVLLLDNMLASSASLPLEMLGAADTQARRRRSDMPRLHSQTAALRRRKVATSAGFNIQADTLYSHIEQTDYLILPALWRNPLRAATQQQKLLQWIRQLHERGTIICAVSTGSFLLAEAGLLDHKPGTTHWFYLDLFERRYPLVQTQRHHLITQTNSIYCAGSVNALADLMVYFARQIYGEEISRHMESQFSPEIRRAYSATMYTEEGEHPHHDEDIARVQDYLTTHCNETLSLTEVADKFGLSSRTFNRRFKQITGSTPLQYLQRSRLENAQELLRNSNLSVAEIAGHVGYQDVSYFASLFRKHFAMPPMRYRRSVRGKLFAVH